jgi:hypothetical protein
MPSIINTLEGVPLGTTLTTTNSGGTSGNAANTVTLSTGSTMEATSFRTGHGSRSLTMIHASGGAAHRVLWNFAEAGRLVFTTYFLAETVPTVVDDVMAVRNATGTMCVLGIGADGKLVMTNAAGAGISASRATNAIPADTWLRLEVEVQKGTTTTDGLMGYRYFVGESTTPVFSWTSSVQNTGTTNSASVYLGRSTGRAQTWTVYYDSMQAQTLTSGWIAPYVAANLAPTAVAGSGGSGILPGTVITLTGSNSTDSDGTISSYSWAQTGGPTVVLTGSGAVRTFTAPAVAGGTNLDFTLTVTDNSGATGTDSVSFSVLSPGGTSTQVQNTFDGGMSGSDITPANSGGGSGTAFDYTETTTGGSIKFTTTAAHGGKAMVAAGNAGKGFVQWSVGSTKKLTGRFYVRYPALPTASNNVVIYRSEAAQAAGIIWHTTGKLQVTGAAGSSIHDTPVLTTNAWYRVEFAVEIGTTTANSKVWFGLYSLDSTTAVDTFTSTTENLGIDPMVLMRFGKIDNAGNNTFYFDSVTYDPTSTSLLGPHAPLAVPPIANAGSGANNVEPGTTLFLNGTASTDPDGTIASFAWAQTAGETVTITGTGATRTVIAPPTVTGTVLGFELTVTDGDGLTSTATVAYTVLPASERVVLGGVEVAVVFRDVSGGIEK